MILHYLVLVLETLFFVGMAGSLVVAIWAFVGDIHVLFDKDKDKPSHQQLPVPPPVNAVPQRAK